MSTPSSQAGDLAVGRLVARRDVGGGLVLHELQTSREQLASYRVPGQYLSLGIAAKSTYFVLAGEPGAPSWEVLVRDGGDVADALLASPVGASIELSRALGSGFPIADAAARRLVIVATGSGIAAVRPVLAARVRAGLARATEVFVGVWTRRDLPLAEELAAHQAEGITLTVCCSRETAPAEGAEPGYVQDVLARRAAREPTGIEGAMLFAAGGGAMIDAIRGTARALGLAEADVRTNY